MNFIFGNFAKFFFFSFLLLAIILLFVFWSFWTNKTKRDQYDSAFNTWVYYKNELNNFWFVWNLIIFQPIIENTTQKKFSHEAVVCCGLLSMEVVFTFNRHCFVACSPKNSKAVDFSRLPTLKKVDKYICSPSKKKK